MTEKPKPLLPNLSYMHDSDDITFTLEDLNFYPQTAILPVQYLFARQKPQITQILAHPEQSVSFLAEETERFGWVVRAQAQMPGSEAVFSSPIPEFSFFSQLEAIAVLEYINNRHEMIARHAGRLPTAQDPAMLEQFRKRLQMHRKFGEIPPFVVSDIRLMPEGNPAELEEFFACQLADLAVIDNDLPAITRVAGRSQLKKLHQPTEFMAMRLNPKTPFHQIVMAAPGGITMLDYYMPNFTTAQQMVSALSRTYFYEETQKGDRVSRETMHYAHWQYQAKANSASIYDLPQEMVVTRPKKQEEPRTILVTPPAANPLRLQEEMPDADQYAERPFYCIQGMHFYAQKTNWLSSLICGRKTHKVNEIQDHPAHHVDFYGIRQNDDTWIMELVAEVPGLEPLEVAVNEKRHTHIQTIQALLTAYEENARLAVMGGYMPPPQDEKLLTYFRQTVENHRRRGELPFVMTTNMLALPATRSQGFAAIEERADYFVPPRRPERLDTLLDGVIDRKKSAPLKNLKQVIQFVAIRQGVDSQAYDICAVSPRDMRQVTAIRGLEMTAQVLETLSDVYLEHAGNGVRWVEAGTGHFENWRHQGAGLQNQQPHQMNRLLHGIPPTWRHPN